jgi:hypothetical protein
MTEKELNHICHYLDYKKIEDRYLCDNVELHDFIRWDRLDKMQSVRVLTRHPELSSKIDLRRFTYKIKEVWYFIKNDHTRLFKYFDFDLKNLPKEDAYFLFCLGKEDFLDLIDLEKYTFNHIECFNIIKAYNFQRRVITKLNYSSLKSNQIASIFSNTNEEFLDLFSVDQLTTLDWLELLSYQPGFIKYCDFDKFIQGDPFNLIKLITMFEYPDLSYLIYSIDKGSITPLGWEKLLIHNHNKYLDICDFIKLKENNWLEILKFKPELSIYKN